MLLKLNIWSQIVEAAKQAAAASPAWIRAIERANLEVLKSRYWSFTADGVLTIQSTISRKMYRIGANHTCEATSNGHTACKHRTAHRLMARYAERLAK